MENVVVVYEPFEFYQRDLIPNQDESNRDAAAASMWANGTALSQNDASLYFCRAKINIWVSQELIVALGRVTL